MLPPCPSLPGRGLISPGAVYYPAGELNSAVYGTVLNLTTAFNSRQDITSLKYANSQAQPLWSKAYSWDQNGANLLSVTDQISGNVRSFSYDYMNRLASTMDASGGVSDTYTMDAWGNRQESGTFSFIQPFGPGNQISATGYVYDSSGNLTADGLGNTYSYDADGKMSASNGAAYTRDSFGQRVRKDDSGAATEYFYFGGQLLATRDPSSSQWTDYIYAGSRLIAEIPVTSTDTAFYRIGDHLDSLVQKTDSAGNVLGANDVSPYGELFSSTASDPLLFTQHERDAENSSDSALYRQYASTQGRWLSPDPYNGSYNLADPQSLNRYTYLSGRPQGSVDPDGLYQLAGEGGGDEGVGGLIGSIFYYFFSNLFSGGGGAPAGNPHSTVNTTFGTPYSNTNGTFVFPVNVGLSYADAGTGTGAGFGVAAPVFVFSVSAFDFSLGAPSVSAAVAPSNGQQQTSFKNCAAQKLKPQLNANLNTWVGQLKKAPLVGVTGATAVTGAIVIAEPETLPIAPALFGVLAVNITITAADISTTYAAAKSILQIGGAAISCGAQTF